MPIRIDAKTGGTVCLGLIGVHSAIGAKECRAAGAADMETEFVRIGPVGRMAVDTARERGVLDQRPLTERRQVPLINAHHAVRDVARSQFPVNQAIIRRVLADIY